jgi:ADP-dependent NAD(P)H-hydrate dehydratase / NAD(P)H-hydrate epimerase
MKVVTAAEMKEIDRVTIHEHGTPGLVLMERAGTAVASHAMELFPGKKFLVLCGGGNNGGDGLVAARSLCNNGFRVKALMLSKQDSLSPDCKAQYELADKAGVDIAFSKELTRADLHESVLIDAVFGTGLSKSVSGDLADLFRVVNDSAIPVIAVDIASGISSDTGEVLGEAIRADHTVTFGLPKRGHLLYPGAEYAGSLYVEDIGFPEELVKSETLKTGLISKELAASLVPPRPCNSFKGDYGHVLVIAGSRGKTGAAFMTAQAALRTGSGLVTLGVPETLLDIYQSRVMEEMTLALRDKGNGTLHQAAIDAILNFISQNADVIAIGPGIGVTPATEKIVSQTVLSSAAPVVIDADGLNSLKDSRGILSKAKSPVVITPHPGEMARLLRSTGISIADIEKDRIGTTLSFAEETGVYVVLKGVPTIVATPEGDAFINTTGNPGMATAGSGDVLTGIIASLLGQGLDAASASVLGVYLHGLAGDTAAAVLGEHSLIASDIISALPEAFQCLKNA